MIKNDIQKIDPIKTTMMTLLNISGYLLLVFIFLSLYLTFEGSLVIAKILEQETSNFY